jgi:hypothetical protein
LDGDSRDVGLAVSGSELERVTELRRGGSLAPARRLDRLLSEREPAHTITIWQSPSTTAYEVGTELANYDRECRRAVALLRKRGRIEELPRPVAIRDGHFVIVDASASSLDLVIDAVGILGLVLLSDPVQLLLTADAILGRARSVRAWLHRRSDPLDGISARQAIQLLHEFGELGLIPGLGSADREIEVLRRPTSFPAVEAPVAQPAEYDVLGGEAHLSRHARGHSVTHIRVAPDGTVDILLIE